MATLITLNEAATFLGISKATLRNWDKAGKLIAVRNPINGYRQYDINDLIALKNEIFGENSSPKEQEEKNRDDEIRIIKKIVNKLNCIIRDNDANSNIITRFDEISKLLFLRFLTGKEIFSVDENAGDLEYAKKIKNAYSKIIKSINEKIPKNFKNLNLNNNTLKLCGKELFLLEIDNCNCDIKGLAYEDIIRGTFDKNDNQQYFTPYQIVEFMVKALKPYLHGRVCDPACGTAGFLTKVINCSNTEIIGLEVDERLYWISTLNLLMHGSKNFKVHYLPNGGSLGIDANDFFETMDVILTNPPFGSDYTDKKILDNFILGKDRRSRRRGILFIEQAWNLLKENGILAIIIDKGVLNSNSNIDVREFIFSHFEIMGIIDLPDSAFMPYANVNSSIMVLKKKKGTVIQRFTFFAKSEKIGRKTNGDDDITYYPNGESELNSDLNQILSAWIQYLNGEKMIQTRNCFIAKIDEYIEEDKSLRMDYIYHHPFRKESKKLLSSSKYPLISLSEICIERNQAYVPAADPNATNIPFTGLANIEPNTGIATQELTPAASIKSSVKRYEPMDIVFSKMRPNLRKVAVMNTTNGGYVSSECAVFTVRKDAENIPIVEPEILSVMLRSDFVYGQIMSCVTGIGRPRINGKDLRKILIPIPGKQVQAKIIQTLKSSKATIKQLKDRAEAIREEAETMEIKMVNNIAITMSGGI